MTSAAVKTAGSVATKVFRNKWFWIAIVAIILFVVIRRNWRRITAPFSVDYGDYGAVTPAQIPPYRKHQLEELAKRLHDAMSALFPDETERLGAMQEALDLPDAELKYLANHFKRAITRGESLYEWVDDEWIPFSNIDDELLARLTIIGEHD